MGFCRRDEKLLHSEWWHERTSDLQQNVEKLESWLLGVNVSSLDTKKKMYPFCQCCQPESGFHSSASISLSVTLMSQETTMSCVRAVHGGWWVPTPNLPSPFSVSSPDPITEILEYAVMNVQRLPEPHNLTYLTSTACLGKNKPHFYLRLVQTHKEEERIRCLQN